MKQEKNYNRAQEILGILAQIYPNADTELRFSSDFELLIAVILSAQCTDKRVNEVTKRLFITHNTPEKLAEIDASELEKMIFSCGFYRAKAKNIISASRDIILRFGGKVPSSMEDLVSLAGVGRKTANVMLAVAFGKEAFPVDTHVFRVSRRLGFSEGKTPEQVERDVTELLQNKGLGTAHHLLIFHGRYCCHSQSPACSSCGVKHLCDYSIEKNIKAQAPKKSRKSN